MSCYVSHLSTSPGFERTSWRLAVWIPSTSLWERRLYKVIVSRPVHALSGFVCLDFKAKVLTLDCLPFSLMRIAVGITLSTVCDGPRRHFLTSNCGIAVWEDLMFWVGNFFKNIAWWNNKFKPKLSKTSSQPHTNQNLLAFWKAFWNACNASWTSKFSAQNNLRNWFLKYEHPIPANTSPKWKSSW